MHAVNKRWSANKKFTLLLNYSAHLMRVHSKGEFSNAGRERIFIKYSTCLSSKYNFEPECYDKIAFSPFCFSTQNQRRRVFAKCIAFEYTRAVLFFEMYTGPWQFFGFLFALWREKPLWFDYISLYTNKTTNSCSDCASIFVTILKWQKKILSSQTIHHSVVRAD